MCEPKNNNRAGREHWAEYINFLKKYPCMINDQIKDDQLWILLSKRLNGINHCQKTVEKWKQSIKNWRSYVIRKYEDNVVLSDVEEALMKLITEKNNKKCVRNVVHNKPKSAENSSENTQAIKIKQPCKVQEITKPQQNRNCVLKPSSPKKLPSPERPENDNRLNKIHPPLTPPQANRNCVAIPNQLKKALSPDGLEKANRLNKNHPPSVQPQEIKNCGAKANQHKKLVSPEKFGMDNCLDRIQPSLAHPKENGNGAAKFNQQKILQSPKRFEVDIHLDRISSPIAVTKKNQQRLLQPLKIYYQNVRGLRTKLEKVSSAVLLQNYDIIILTETWLLPAISSHRVFDDRYFVFRTDRSVQTSEKSIGGGVLIAVLKTHGFIKRHLTSGSVEEVWISLVKYNLVVGAVYLPPRTPEAKLKEFLASASILTKSSNTGIVVGDFNMRRITWFKDELKNFCVPTDVTVETFKTLLKGLQSLGIEQRNDIVNANGVILDLVYTNTKSISITKTDSPFVLPDYHHPPLKILLSLNKRKPEGG